jgi:predicted XRE-type DNA-binding protein
MTGFEVKTLIHSEGLKCWQVAELWGLAESNFSRRLRKPFDEQETEKVKAIIAELKTAKGE